VDPFVELTEIPMTKSVTRLEDKYLRLSGRVFLSSNQALVRLPIDQARRDRARGLNTAGYISGYRGSPLGVYDAALWGAEKLLTDHNIRFVPGLNEELAATAIRGTQELAWFGKSRVEGVFGLWYGKGLGVDRACESLKLGNLEGAAAKGGFLAVAGDDHGGKSSASAHQSEHTLIAALLPILYPATVAEILEYGIFGWALSRYSGLYVGLKCITDTLDLTASVELPDPLREIVEPDWPVPPEGFNLRPNEMPLVQEERVVNKRLPAAGAFARANQIDRIVIDGPKRSLGIVAAGKAYLDVRQALLDLGLDDHRCAALGIRVYKPALIWPLERSAATAFAQGHSALLVVEEKRPVIEDQLRSCLYGMPAQQRPEIIGKRDLAGAPLLPAIGELSPQLTRSAIRTALRQIQLSDSETERQFARFEELARRAATQRSPFYRPAFFCSGCPHNTSTRIPDGSIAISAVGCHGLAAYVMPERHTMRPMPMGGDGMPWVSVGPLVERTHVFQNMGDGTYSHSGILAIRAAVAAGANMTFKILYNDAVAMTGGQPVEMHTGPMDVVKQLLAENVAPVLLVTDDPHKYTAAAVPRGVDVHHRDELDKVQRDLRERSGVSAIVYEQTCATEKRRRRKRGTLVDPDVRVFINPEVCEGCGDCSVQSNCVSVQPLDTQRGRKRRIDQSTCNKDLSCLNGFCPSFVTVRGARIATHVGGAADDLSRLTAGLPTPPTVPLDAQGHNLLVAGIGGTGVLTIGALLGMAAHLEGKGCTVLDMTGMAQKGGGVTSHIRTGPNPSGIYTSRLGLATADVILACDLIVATGADVLKSVRPGMTHVVANVDVAPTGESQTNGDFDPGTARMQDIFREALAGGELHRLKASSLAVDLVGDSIATNVLMLGYAAQKGLLPVGVASIEEAIALNGSFVESNLRTFSLGRLAAHSPDSLPAGLPERADVGAQDSIEQLVETRAQWLTGYQSSAYADEYRRFVREIQTAVAAKRLEGGDALVREVSRTLGKIMAYKDEYEVARLHTDTAFWQQLQQQFAGDFKVTFHLAPPLLPGRDSGGRPKKRAFGPWMLPVFQVLRRLRVLRGTPFDPFGYTAERRMERRLIAEYRDLMRFVTAHVDQSRLQTAVELAKAAQGIRGYGPVKDASVARYGADRARLLSDFGASPDGPPSREPLLTP
jgi:indolepyruvate ferredoxin oxidoreductase